MWHASRQAKNEVPQKEIAAEEKTDIQPEDDEVPAEAKKE